jgi:hypothetical protein
MLTFGQESHPRVLFTGFDSENDLQYQAMSRLVPTASLMPDRGLLEVRGAEWDIVVSKAASVDARRHMHVLALGCSRVGTVSIRGAPTVVEYQGRQPSPIMEVPDDLPGGLQRLIVSELIPYLRSLSFRPYLRLRSVGSVKANGLVPTLPFVVDAEQNLIAGAFEHHKNRWCWALPYMPDHPELWFAAALEDWHQRTPQLVPMITGWNTRETWMTQKEIAIRADLEALAQERMRLIEKLSLRELELSSAQSTASAVADRGVRQLVTGKSRSLIQATMDAFRQLEFDVEDVDQHAHIGSEMEDLRLQDPHDPSWTNITQIRGYADAAKLGDIQRLTLFAEQFSNRNGSLPTSSWYVVNQFLSTDPDLRPLPLGGSKEDVERFANNGGLILDTRELFQLVRAVDAGRLTPAEARRMLRSATGVFEFHVNAHRTSSEVVSTEPSESDVVSTEPDRESEWPLYPSAYRPGRAHFTTDERVGAKTLE